MRRTPIDMDVVRDLHAKGWKLKAIAAALGIRYNRLSEHTSRAGLRFRNCPHKTLRPKPKRVRKPPKKVGADSLTTMRREHDRTRQILDLDREREHAPHWLKPEYTRQIEALRA